MIYLDHPSVEIWNERKCWFEQSIEQAQGLGSYFLSEQACALIAETQVTFCAGAWIGVTILAHAVIEGQLREVEVPDFKGSSYQLLHIIGADDELHWLRKRRNELLHLNPLNPAVTVDQLWNEQDRLEADARKAVGLMLMTFFMSPGT